jgi:hypothetical protein
MIDLNRFNVFLNGVGVGPAAVPQLGDGSAALGDCRSTLL